MNVDSQVSRDLIVADIVARTGIDEAMIKRLVRTFYGRARPRSSDRAGVRKQGA
jgi:hypothetical protein